MAEKKLADRLRKAYQNTRTGSAVIAVQKIERGHLTDRAVAGTVFIGFIFTFYKWRTARCLH